MFCGPEGGRGCFSLLGREMVKLRNIPIDDTLGHVVGLCLDNLVHDDDSIQQSFVLCPHIRNKVCFECNQLIVDRSNASDLFLFGVVCKRTFRLCSRERHSGPHSSLLEH